MKSFLKKLSLYIGLLGVLFPTNLVIAEEDLIIFSASSIGPAIEEIVGEFENETGQNIRVSQASSSTLARQIENGAPAHLFISANRAWYNYLAQKRVINEIPIKIASNSLVVAAHSDENNGQIKDFESFIKMENRGRLAVADTDSVPLGIYTKEALNNLGLWDTFKPELAPARNAASVLAFIENKTTSFGIVYKSDTILSKKVNIVMDIPKNTHSPIAYFASSTKNAHPSSDQFLSFLTSKRAKGILIQFGFEGVENGH